MSQVYSEQHRKLQDQFSTRKMADRLEEMIVKPLVDDMDKGFIESRDFFFLSTVDQTGHPTTSYKGGDPGFIRVVDPQTIAFPSYDGNGMFFSMGNISANPKIGILFIDFENPHRLRLHGEATVTANDPLLSAYKEAELIVRVKITKIWVNCPRYIHRMQRVAPSRYVPRAACETPLAVWKRLDLVQDVLPPKDVGRAAAAGGVITMDDYFAKLMKGEA
ncbi:MAG: pyridoxamine 5'-phosphate oxidase family protein [Gammaproteobacteria bacterium]|nr:pyridoxamine 5'-phosphate oxidase family protein [Gammaproteobacteria bacterium]